MTLQQEITIQIGADRLVVNMRVRNQDAVLLGADVGDAGIDLAAEWPAGTTLLMAPEPTADRSP